MFAPISYSSYISNLIRMARDENFPHMARAARVLLHREGLGQCDHEDDFSCKAVATVHAIETEQEFCSAHYRKVTR